MTDTEDYRKLYEESLKESLNESKENNRRLFGVVDVLIKTKSGNGHEKKDDLEGKISEAEVVDTSEKKDDIKNKKEEEKHYSKEEEIKEKKEIFQGFIAVHSSGNWGCCRNSWNLLCFARAGKIIRNYWT